MSVVGGHNTNQMTMSRTKWTSCGGMYSDTDIDAQLMWNNLKHKLSLIGLSPFESGNAAGDCFFSSVAHGLYNNPNLHLQIRCAGITHMKNNAELYIESLAEVSWEQYVYEMSQQGTCCDNVIMQAVANALNCTIHITDSNSSTTNAVVITPFESNNDPKCIFLGYLNELHYVSTCALKNGENEVNLVKQDIPMPRSELHLVKKRQLDKQAKACETEQQKNHRLAKNAKHNKQKRASETVQETNSRLAKAAQYDNHAIFNEGKRGLYTNLSTLNTNN